MGNFWNKVSNKAMHILRYADKGIAKGDYGALPGAVAGGIVGVNNGAVIALPLSGAINTTTTVGAICVPKGILTAAYPAGVWGVLGGSVTGMIFGVGAVGLAGLIGGIIYGVATKAKPPAKELEKLGKLVVESPAVSRSLNSLMSVAAHR